MRQPFTCPALVSLFAHGGIIAVFFFLMLTPTDRVMVGEGVVEAEVFEGVGYSDVIASETKQSPDATDFRRSPRLVGAGLKPATTARDDNQGNPTLTTIWKKINRAKYYPLVAREQKLEGAPRVQFQISEDGEVTNVSLIDSSGSEILDDAALETIRRAAPLPSYPELITLAIRYSLTD